MIKSLFLNIFWHKKGILKTYGSAIFLSTVCLVFPNKSLNNLTIASCSLPFSLNYAINSKLWVSLVITCFIN